ncbi:MAG: M20/M25/M40 family metallo-hydrolase [Desulfobacterales bacterium]
MTQNSFININSDRLKRLFKDIVDIYSPSGKEEQVLEFLNDYLKEQGFRIKRQHVDENRYNLLVFPKKDMDAEVVFMGHVDTIPAYEFDNFGWEEKGDRIIGLGTADMKGGCAAMIEALITSKETLNKELPAALALVVGEEEDGDGAAKLLEEYYFPWVIIGEPTNMHPCLGHFGYMEILLRTFGKRMHASLANKKENAIEVLLSALIDIGQYMGTVRRDVVYNIRDLFSSRTGFTVADRCEAWLDIHIPPSSPVGEIATELEEVFLSYCEKHKNIKSTFRITTIEAGYELPPRGPIVESLQKVYAQREMVWKPNIFRSHSDANQLWTAGIKPILLGAGRLEMAHTPEESVSFQKICKAAQIYADLISELISEQGGNYH